MPVYKVKVWWTSHTVSEVVAKDEEEAEYKAVMNADTTQIIDNLEAMEYVNEVTLCDSQYTDQQELKDRESDT